MILKVKKRFKNSWKISFWSAIRIWAWIIIFDAFNLNFHKFIRHSNKTKSIVFVFSVKKSSLSWIDIWVTKIVSVLSRCAKSKLMYFFSLNWLRMSLFLVNRWLIKPFCTICAINSINKRLWRKSLIFVNVSVVLKMFVSIKENIIIAFFYFW